MKKYKPFRFLLEYLKENFGITITEEMAGADKSQSIKLGRFRFGGAIFCIPYTLDWDWTRDNTGYYIRFYHDGDNSLSLILMDELKKVLYNYGTKIIPPSIHIYFNSTEINL